MKKGISAMLTLALCGAFAKAEDYKYAPVPKVIQGKRTLACIGMKWQDIQEPQATAGQCESIARQVDLFFTRNSRSLLNFETKGFQFNVPLNRASKNISKAESMAIAAHKGFDMYDMILGPILTSHAGKGVAHLRGRLYRDSQHEVGHLLGLGHAGAYKKEKGKMSLDAYGDGESVMSRMSSPFLTAPQYYHQGWLPKKEAVIYEPGKTYKLKKTADVKTEALSVVIVPAAMFHGVSAPNALPGAKGVRDAFVSHSNKWGNCAVLHLSQGGGSQRVQVICGEYYDDDFTDLHVKILKKEGATITVSLDFNKKPQSFQAEAEPADAALRRDDEAKEQGADEVETSQLECAVK